MAHEDFLANLENIPALDLGRLEKIYQLRPQKVLELIEVFLTENGERLEEISDSLQNGAMTGLDAAAHSVKGSSATLGAQRLAELSGRLELVLRDEDLEASRALIGPTQKELHDIRGLLDAQIAVWDAAGET